MVEEKEMQKEKQMEMQKKYLEFSLLNQQIKQIQSNIELLNNQIAELRATQESLDSLAVTKNGSELFVPINPGIFVKAQLLDNSELAVNVGAGVVVKKSIPETKALLDEQLNELKKVHQQLVANLEECTSQAAMLEKEIAKIVK